MGMLAADATLRRLATGAIWSEGPVWLPDAGAVRWSDIPNNRILQYRLESGELSVYSADAEFTNGRTLDASGAVIQCSHGRRAVERDVGGVVTTIVDRWNGVRFNSPNDVVVAGDGAIWFTDPPYGIDLPREGHPGEREYGGCYVFRFEPTTGVVVPVVTDMEKPNGLAFSPDESILYVSDTSWESGANESGNHHIRAYDVIDGARCGRGRTIAVIEPGVPDGFRVDVDGRLWTSSADSVQVLSATGEPLDRIPVPEVVANVCFGGPDGSTLFIAASTSLYAIDTATRGAGAGTAAA
jgi:gluconolactonase